VQRDGRLIVAVEVGPIQHGEDVFPCPDNEWHPVFEQVPDAYLVIAQQSVDLLHCVSRLYAARPSHAGSNGVDIQRSGMNRAQRGIGQRFYLLCVQRLGEHVLDDGLHLLRGDRLRSRHGGTLILSSVPSTFSCNDHASARNAINKCGDPSARDVHLGTD
jgi:hypothetical protein